MVAKKLLIVTHYFPAHRGGVEIVAGELAARLATSTEVDIRWLASDTDPPPEQTARLDPIPISACNWLEMHLSLPYPLWSLPGLLSLVREVKRSDVVQLHDFIYLSNIVAFIAAKTFRKPIIVTQHIGFIPYNSRVLRLLLTLINRSVGALVLGHAEQVIHISESVRAYYDRFICYRKAPTFIANGVDHQTFCPASTPDRQAIRRTLDLKPDDIVFAFVGRFIEKKGLPLLRVAAERLHDVKWIFAGVGPLDPEGWQLRNVMVLRDRRGVELANVYRAADLLVLPSKGEGFPLVVQEAMACGTPCFMGEETLAAFPGLKDVAFGDDIEGPGAEQRLLDALEHMTRHREILQTIRPMVAEFALAHWSWKACADRYAEILSAFGAPARSGGKT